MACCCVLVCRYALVKEKRALTKFLKCVDWTDAQEAQQVGLWRDHMAQHFTAQHSTAHHTLCLRTRRHALPVYGLVRPPQADGQRRGASKGGRTFSSVVTAAAATTDCRLPTL